MRRGRRAAAGSPARSGRSETRRRWRRRGRRAAPAAPGRRACPSLSSAAAAWNRRRNGSTAPAGVNPAGRLRPRPPARPPGPAHSMSHRPSRSAGREGRGAPGRTCRRGAGRPRAASSTGSDTSRPGAHRWRSARRYPSPVARPTAGSRDSVPSCCGGPGAGRRWRRCGSWSTRYPAAACPRQAAAAGTGRTHCFSSPRPACAARHGRWRPCDRRFPLGTRSSSPAGLPRPGRS